MNKIIEETIAHAKVKDYGERYVQNLDIILKWTDDPVASQWIAEGIQQEMNILIFGRCGTGKTKLVNELLRMTDPRKKFRYVYRSSGDTFNDIEMHPEFHERIEYSINMEKVPFHNLKRGIPSEDRRFWIKPDFFVIDDVNPEDLSNIVSRIYEDIQLPMIATIEVNERDDIDYININLKRFFNIFIMLESFQNISNVLFNK